MEQAHHFSEKITFLIHRVPCLTKKKVCFMVKLNDSYRTYWYSTDLYKREGSSYLFDLINVRSLTLEYPIR